MNPFISKSWKGLLTAILALAAFAFWQWGYPYALAFQEQCQLFLFDGDYLCSRLAEPGGVARYVAEFLVQFFNHITTGAIIMALLLVLMQRLVWRLMRPAHQAWYLLSFVPPLLFWILMGDENVMPTALVALNLMLLSMVLCPKGKKASTAYLLVAMPLLYWVVGPLALLAAVYVAARHRKGWSGAVWAGVAVAYMVAVIIVSGFCLPFPLKRLFLGMSYYRYVEVLSYLFAGVALVCLALALAGGRLPQPKAKSMAWRLVAPQVAVVAALVAWLGTGAYDSRKFDLIAYDYLVRANQWDKIISMSEKRQPDLPMSVCATNLALAMKQQLGERAFEFYQRGTEGLLPKFHRNFATLQLTAEAYFQLGLVNTAQRLSFEAMEALPNYNKSARAVKRLAETNLINGQYGVARKYLSMLGKTIFYRNWARRTAKLLGNEQAINQHPLYGRLRSMRLDNDLLFSEQEADKICGQLFMRNNANTMAMQYLLLYPLLEGNIGKYVGYAQIVQNKVPYNPRSCQEATAYAFMRENQMPPQGLVPPMVVSQLQDFVATVKNGGKNAPQLEMYKNSVWYYLTREE